MLRQKMTSDTDRLNFLDRKGVGKFLNPDVSLRESIDKEIEKERNQEISKRRFSIICKSNNLSTIDPMYPNNQRTYSEFVLRQTGEVLEIIYCDDGDIINDKLDQNNFVVQFDKDIEDC